VQSREIAGRSGSAFAQTSGPLGCAFANVRAALAHVLAGAGPSFLLLVLPPGLRLGGSLILTWIHGTPEGRQAQKSEYARRHKNGGELQLRFHFPFSCQSIQTTITSYTRLMLPNRRQVTFQEFHPDGVCG
jgi:hypothetical protein